MSAQPGWLTAGGLLRPADLVMVVLVRDAAVSGLLPTYRPADLPGVAAVLERLGIGAVKVFASPVERHVDGCGGQRPDSLMTRAISALKGAVPELVVMTETCLCSWTPAGDCHLPGTGGEVDVPATLDALAAQAVAQAEAGADVVGPAAMAPGQVAACRRALDENGHGHVRIMPHLILSSELYTGYRAAMNAAPASGRRVFQIPAHAADEAVRTGLDMLAEGADALLLEPALMCCDILTALRARTSAPLVPFSVSGERLTLPGDVLAEEYVMLRRAGADQVITYGAVELADAWAGEAVATGADSVVNSSPSLHSPATIKDPDAMTITPSTLAVPAPAEEYFAGKLPDRPLRLGCRRSHLARAYASRVVDALHRVAPGLRVELVEITTSGDRHKGDLSKIGGKGQFMKEIDKALTLGQVDMAMHAMKDVPGDIPLPEGLVFAAYLEREDVRDCVVWREGGKYASIDDLPPGAALGTSAVRRKAQILRHRPDLQVERFRGNVVPRIAKLDEGDHLEGIVLSRGGLVSVGMDHRIGQTFTMEEMCPAVGAGVVGVQCRKADEGMVELLQLVDHAETRTHITAERTMLHGLQGHCNSPIAGHCRTTEDGQLSLQGMVFTREGANFAYAQEWDTVNRAFELGAYVAGVLTRKGARDIIAGIPH